jgi:hypothetical protein
MTIICLEGLDRCGKTTAAAQLQAYGFEVIHMSAPPRDASSWDYFFYLASLFLATVGRDVVLDRTHWGEAVWPFVFGREPKLSLDAIRTLDRMLSDYHGGSIHRWYFHDPDVEALKARIAKDREVVGVERVMKSIQLYESNVVAQSEWTRVTFPEISERICQLITTIRP